MNYEPVSQAGIEKVIIVSLEQNRKGLKNVVAAVLGFLAVTVMSAQVMADAMVEKAIIDRIKPIGEVNVGTAPVAAAPSSGAADGKGTYTASCAACHGTGAAGSPKFGDKGAWKARIAQGEATLFEHALNGFKGMPAKGGNASLSDDAVKAAVKYMVSQSK